MPYSGEPTYKGWLTIPEGGPFSERIHPGPPRDWHGTNQEWHERLLLYFDALEVEKEFARFQEVASMIPQFQTELEITASYVQRLTDLQRTAPQRRATPTEHVTSKYQGEISG